MYFTKVFVIPFVLVKILNNLLFLIFLLACIMVNTIRLVILWSAFVIIILSLLMQYVANARNPQSDPRIHPSGLDIILNMSCISIHQIVVDCTPSLFNLSILNQSVGF